MRFLPLLALFLASCTSTTHSPDRSEVLDVVQAFFDVIESKDVERGAELTLADASFVNVRRRDGVPAVGQFTAGDWLRSLGEGSDPYLEEFVGTPTVRVDGDLAMVWTEYRFEVDGELSHTGFDAFHLVRTEEGWKISGAAYSVVRPEPVP